MRTETWTTRDRHGEYEVTSVYLDDPDDIDEKVEGEIASAVEWFEGSRTMGTEEFIDRFCRDTSYEVEQYDGPVARKIMRIARRIRAEQQ